MSKTLKLGNISEISTGLVLSRKQASEHDFIRHYKLLTVKSFDDDGWLNTKELDDFYSSEILDSRYLTKKGDIIIRLSHPHTTIAVDYTNEGMVISSLFAYIRLTSELVLPEFLSVYINSDIIKGFFNRNSHGIALKMIRTSDLNDIKIRLLPIEKQEQIINLFELTLKEKRLLKDLMVEKNNYHRMLINEMLGE